MLEDPRDDAARRAGLSCSAATFVAGSGKAGSQRLSPDRSPTYSAQHEPTGSSRSSGDSAPPVCSYNHRLAGLEGGPDM
jgi:hypothetical protein